MGHKKVMQHLGTNKITQPLSNFANQIMQYHGTKNHRTSRKQKKSRNLSGQKKSRNLSGQKKITQPPGTQKGHATSRDKQNHTTSLKFLSGNLEFVTVYLGLVH